jgi:hypothetical protein
MEEACSFETSEIILPKTAWCYRKLSVEEVASHSEIIKAWCVSFVRLNSAWGQSNAGAVLAHTAASSVLARKQYFVTFRSPSLLYLLTVGVEVVYFHLITLRHTPQSVGLLWTRDRPGGIRTHDPSKRSAAHLRPRPRGHWDRLHTKTYIHK